MTHTEVISITATLTNRLSSLPPYFTPGHRPVIWRMLLGYLPYKQSEWPAHLNRQRELYHSFLESLTARPSHSTSSSTNVSPKSQEGDGGDESKVEKRVPPFAGRSPQGEVEVKREKVSTGR